MPDPRGRASKLHGDLLRSWDLWNTLWQSFHDSYFNKSKQERKIKDNKLPNGFSYRSEKLNFPSQPLRLNLALSGSTAQGWSGGRGEQPRRNYSHRINLSITETFSQPSPIWATGNEPGESHKLKIIPKLMPKKFSITFPNLGLAHSILSPFLEIFAPNNPLFPLLLSWDTPWRREIREQDWGENLFCCSLSGASSCQFPELWSYNWVHPAALSTAGVQTYHSLLSSLSFSQNFYKLNTFEISLHLSDFAKSASILRSQDTLIVQLYKSPFLKEGGFQTPLPLHYCYFNISFIPQNL